MNRRLAALATTLILAIPAIAVWAAQAPFVTFTPAAGTERYEIRIRTLDSDVRHIHQGTETVIEIPRALLPPLPYWIDVRGGDGGLPGKWSALFWNTADLDGDGVVGGSDFMALVARWDEHSGRDYIEMARRWNARTEANAEGLRWYVEEMP